jgi:hypothetical protein
MTLCLSCHGEKDIRRRKDLLFSKVGYCKKGHKLTDLKYYKYCKVCQIERNKKQTTILGMDKREYFRKYMNNYYHTVVVHKRCLKGLQS